jgi:hypothetical protein
MERPIACKRAAASRASVVEMPLPELWSMVEGGKIADMKTLTLALMLHTRHPELFRPGAASGDPAPPAAS